MGLFRRIGFGLTALAGYLGLTPTPDTDDARVERIDKMYEAYAKEFSAVPSLTVDELMLSRQAGKEWVLVDTRTPEERAVSTVPGAVPAEMVEASVVSYRGKNLVAYCTIGYRSGLWAAKMAEQGLTVHNLEGSLLSWTHAGQPLVTPAGEPTHRVHVYGPPWNLAHTDYTPTW